MILTTKTSLIILLEVTNIPWSFYRSVIWPFQPKSLSACYGCNFVQSFLVWPKLALCGIFAATNDLSQDQVSNYQSLGLTRFL